MAARLNLPAGAAGEPVLAEDVYGPWSGQVTSAARQALRRGVAEAHPRLVEAMFLCEVASAAEALSGGCTWGGGGLGLRVEGGAPAPGGGHVPVRGGQRGRGALGWVQTVTAYAKLSLVI